MILFTITTALFAAACAAPNGLPAYNAPQPSYYPTPKYKEVPKPYKYAYGVKEQYTGTNFEAAEGSDGNVVNGHYSVLLPDGRLQNVKYTADHYSGYIADVSYEGYAEQYAPVHKPAPAYHAAPKPVYHPAPKPVYHPAPKPVYHPAPKPVYHPAPIHKAAPVYHPAPIHKPAPVYHPAPVYKPAPVYHG